MIPKRQTAIVAHLGAREHYAVPVAFDSAGILKSFYTDFYVGQLSHIFSQIPLPLQFDLLKRMLGRQCKDLNPSLVHSFPLLGMKYFWLLHRSQGVWQRRTVQLRIAKDFLRKIVERDPLDTDIIYAFDHVALELFDRAKSKNITKVLNQTNLSLWEEAYLQNEYEKWSSWMNLEKLDYPLEFSEREQSEWALADIIVVNSNYAKRALISMGVPAAKLRVVPLSINTNQFYPLEERKDGPARKFLFVGTVAIRKGIQYALQAFKGLNCPEITFSAVGKNWLHEKILSDFRDVCHFQGEVSRMNLLQVYNSGDVLVFPTVSDGFGIVQLEAMACGLPVITTPNSGEVVVDGECGFIVPVGDVEALRDRIMVLASDQDLFEYMRMNAIKRAGEFSWSAYQTRLLQAVNAIEETFTQ
jgi:glycosyltransferase involved in cell wall biosynthesis